MRAQLGDTHREFEFFAGEPRTNCAGEDKENVARDESGILATSYASVLLGGCYQRLYFLHHGAAALLEVLAVNTLGKKGKLLQKNAGERGVF